MSTTYTFVRTAQTNRGYFNFIMTQLASYVGERMSDHFELNMAISYPVARDLELLDEIAFMKIHGKKTKDDRRIAVEKIHVFRSFIKDFIDLLSTEGKETITPRIDDIQIVSWVRSSWGLWIRFIDPVSGDIFVFNFDNDYLENLNTFKTELTQTSKAIRSIEKKPVKRPKK